LTGAGAVSTGAITTTATAGAGGIVNVSAASTLSALANQHKFKRSWRRCAVTLTAAGALRRGGDYYNINLANVGGAVLNNSHRAVAMC